MKAFKEYLVESARTFDFRVRIADHELSGDILDKIERGLAAFDLADISKPKSQPVAHCAEFASLGPVARQQFDVKLNYPATSEGIKTVIHNSAKIPACCIVVRTAMEDDLFASAHVHHPEESLQAGIDTYPLDDAAQDHVGLNRVNSLLKELETARKENKPQAVRNVNDAILAKDLHQEKTAKTTAELPQGTRSPVNTNNPDPRGKKK